MLSIPSKSSITGESDASEIKGSIIDTLSRPIITSVFTRFLILISGIAAHPFIDSHNPMVTFLPVDAYRQKVPNREIQNSINHKTRCALLRNHPEPHAQGFTCEAVVLPLKYSVKSAFMSINRCEILEGSGSICPHCDETGITEEISTRTERIGAIPYW